MGRQQRGGQPVAEFCAFGWIDLRHPCDAPGELGEEDLVVTAGIIGTGEVVDGGLEHVIALPRGLDGHVDG